MRSRRRVPFALCLALSLLLGATGCSRDDKSSGGKKPSPSAAPSVAAFKATSIQAVDPGDRTQANEKANQVAAQVVELINSYYAIAFVDPAKWGEGQHGDLAALFRDDVKAQVPAQLQGLALGDLAPKLTKVTPSKEEVAVRVYVTGDDLSTPVVFIATAFEGSAEARSKDDGPVKVTHSLNVLLTPDAGGFKIAGGTAELHADTGAGAIGPIDRSVSWGEPL
jgi:hypothetical protein